VLRDSLDPKDRLVAWACQEHREKKVCLESPARRASLAYPGRKEPKERKGRWAYLALEFQAVLGTREIKGSQAFRGVLERKEKKAALVSQGSLAPQAPRARQGVSAIQVGEPGPLPSLGVKMTGRLKLMAFWCLLFPIRKPRIAWRKR